MGMYRWMGWREHELRHKQAISQLKDEGMIGGKADKGSGRGHS